MAGVKGRSGGPRKNAGGARPGAGRKPNPPVLGVIAATDDPAAFLEEVMNDNEADMKLRLDAAKALMPFKHAKKGELGKKEQKQADAAGVAAGRFRSAEPPKLRAVK